MRIVTGTRWDETEEWERHEEEFDGTFAEWVAQRKPEWDRLKDITPKEYIQIQIDGGKWTIFEPANWKELLDNM